MKIYRAETGKRLHLDNYSTEYVHYNYLRLPGKSSLESIKAAVELASGVPASMQILMTGDGLPVKADKVEEVLRTSGENESIVYLFSRELLNTTNVVDNTTLREIASLQPQIPLWQSAQLRANWRTFSIAAYVELFEKHNEHGMKYVHSARTHLELCERLLTEQKVQAKALTAAMENLDVHNKSITELHQAFHDSADKEVTEQSELIFSVSVDLEVLKRIKIHPQIMRVAGLIPQQNESHTLASFISEEDLLKLEKSGKAVFEQLKKRIGDLERTVRNVQATTDELKRKKYGTEFLSMDVELSKARQTYEKIKELNDRLQRDIGRIREKAQELTGSSTDAIERLAIIHEDDYLPDMGKFDKNLRDQVTWFIQRKNAMTGAVMDSLRGISRVQSSIASIPSALSRLDAEIKTATHTFKDLSIVHEMPLAYGLTVVEIVRRKEYMRILLERSQKLAEVLSLFRDTEQKRRDTYRLNVKRYMPFNIAALDEAPPMCEISTVNRRGRLPELTREDIRAFVNMLEQMRVSVHKTTGNNQINDNPVAQLQSALLKMSSQIDGMNVEFERIIRTNFVSDKLLTDRDVSTSSRTTSTYSTLTVPARGQASRTVKRLSRQSFSESEVDSGSLLLDKSKKLELAENKLKNYESRIKGLESKLQTNYQNSRKVEESYSTALKETETLTKKVTELDARLQTLDGLYATAIEEKEAAEKRANDLDEKYCQLQLSYEKSVHEVETMKKTNGMPNEDQQLLEVHLSGIQKENELLKEQNRNLSDQLKEETERRISESMLHNERKSASENIEQRLNEQLNERDKLIEQLQKRLETEEYKRKEFESLYHTELDKTKSLQAQYSDLRHSNEKEMASLQSKLKEIERELTEEIKAYEEGKASLTRQLEEAKSQASAKEHEYSDLEQVYKKIQYEFEQCQAELEKRRENYDSEMKQRAVLENEINTLRSESESLVEQTRNSQKELQDLVAKREQEHVEYETSLEEMRAQTQKLQGEIKELNTKIESKETKNKLNEQKIEEMKQKATSHAAKRDKMQSNITELEKTIAELQSSLKTLHSSNSRYSKACHLVACLLLDYYTHFHSLMASFHKQLPLSPLSTTSTSFSSTSNSGASGADADPVGNLAVTFSETSKEEMLIEEYEKIANAAKSVNLDEACDWIKRSVKDAESLLKKAQKDLKTAREKYQKASQDAKDKIAFRNFRPNDIALFLPTRQNTTKTWAAFNVNAPHYFLRSNETLEAQLQNKMYTVRRILNITEQVADSKNPQTSAYELPDGVRFFLVDVDATWNPNQPSSPRHRRQSESLSSSRYEAPVGKLTKTEKQALRMSASVSDLPSREENNGSDFGFGETSTRRSKLEKRKGLGGGSERKGDGEKDGNKDSETSVKDNKGL